MIVAGLDLGRRADYSALVLVNARAKRITGAYRLKQASYREQLASIEPLLKDVSLLAVDRGGVGDGVVELIKPGPKVMPVVIVGGQNFNERPDGSFTAGKRGLVELFRISGVTMAPDAVGREELKKELGAFVFSGSGMEADRGHHDDLVMAALLGVFACAQALRETAVRH